MSDTLPLFPLDVVLLPGGWLDLRIFEPRYLDLVRDCTRNNRTFGVVRLESGRDTDRDVAFASVGCDARIIDFDALPDGLLGIRVEGVRRFRVQSRTVQGNGLHVATVDWLPTPDTTPVPPDYAVLVTILERLAEHGDTQLSAAAKTRFDDAEWVGFRIIERLALESHEKQYALEFDDPIARLQWIIEQLPRFQAE